MEINLREERKEKKGEKLARDILPASSSSMPKGCPAPSSCCLPCPDTGGTDPKCAVGLLVGLVMIKFFSIRKATTFGSFNKMIIKQRAEYNKLASFTRSQAREFF